MQQVSESAMKRIIFACVFFGNDVISSVGFWPFWFMLPDPRPNCKREVFHSSFLLEARLEFESFEPFD